MTPVNTDGLCRPLYISGKINSVQPQPSTDGDRKLSVSGPHDGLQDVTCPGGELCSLIDRVFSDHDSDSLRYHSLLRDPGLSINSYCFSSLMKGISIFINTVSHFY